MTKTEFSNRAGSAYPEFNQKNSLRPQTGITLATNPTMMGLNSLSHQKSEIGDGSPSLESFELQRIPAYKTSVRNKKFQTTSPGKVSLNKPNEV